MRRYHRPAPARAAMLAAAVMVAGLVSACASFPAAAPSFSVQPSLTPTVATVVPETPAGDGAQPSVVPTTGSSPNSPPSPSPSSTGPSPSPTAGSSTGAADPCAIPQPPVIAVCLSDPWGLAPLPDGQSALVGERTTGRILRITPGHAPEPVITVNGVDAAGAGGLLGLALSPAYQEDGLVYAYVTTKSDSRIVRFAAGQQAKAIYTGIPATAKSPGGPIVFGADGMLYVASGSAVLRLDEFGKPAAGNDHSSDDDRDGDGGGGGGHSVDGDGNGDGDGATFATGLTDPTGMCVLPDGTVGVVDHRGGQDVLIRVRNGADYRSLASGDAVWTFDAGDGGGVDCAISGTYLLASSLTQRLITSLHLRDGGGFTGAPQKLLADRYGRLRSLAPGSDGMTWVTTANKDALGSGTIPGASASDDRVFILPPDAAGGGSGGGLD